MLRRISPVYTSFRSDILSRISPASKWVGLTVFSVAVCIGACGVPAQQEQSQPVAAQTRNNASSQSSEAIVETSPSDRQLQIAQQSAGLLQMAKDLKAALDATTSDTLSVAAFRKADAIERFTQTVKDGNKRPSRKP